MAQVTVTIHGRPHRLDCGDGDVDRIVELSRYLEAKIDGLTAEGGSVSYDRLLVMAALLVTDELFEARGGAGVGDQHAAVADPFASGQSLVETRGRNGRSGRPARLTAKDAPSVPPAGE